MQLERVYVAVSSCGWSQLRLVLWASEKMTLLQPAAIRRSNRAIHARRHDSMLTPVDESEICAVSMRPTVLHHSLNRRGVMLALHSMRPLFSLRLTVRPDPSTLAGANFTLRLQNSLGQLSHTPLLFVSSL
jgi:hypothetical protein